MANVFDYIFHVGGNFTAQINGMSEAAGNFSAQAEVAESRGRSFAAALATFSYLKDVAQNIAGGFSALTESGVRLDSQMHDLSAVAGVTGEGLKQIETFARESAKAFGTDASVAVEGYKLLLSQLSPELGKYPDALREMGDCIQTTSKLMGGDGVAAAQVLTTAMNQYGVSMENPTAAAGEMARMMNVMAAAGQAGSAELPAISAALQQCGMAAKAANVSFEETNAAIQVLDKAGKKASEGGVALRNVLGQLSKGRFVEKQAAEELQKAGIEVVALGDNSKSLKERLEMLKPMLNDSALLSKFFGVENANAARALIQGTDALQGFTDAVTGTNSATEQAAIVMDGYAERQARVNQKIEDFKITLFQATGDLSIWCGTLTASLVPLAQLSPLLMGAVSVMRTAVNLKWGAMWQGFAMSATAACRTVSASISSIPIIGWIAGIVSLVGYLCYRFEWFRYVVLSVVGGIGGLLITAFKLLWDNVYSVRLAFFTLWEAAKVVGAYLFRCIKSVADTVLGYISAVWNAYVSLARRITELYTALFSRIVETVRHAVSMIRETLEALKGYVVNAANAVMLKLSSICEPLVTSLSKVANGVKTVFMDIFNWVEDKYSSFVNWLVDTYNKIAAAFGWEKIKTVGRIAADKSWSADHGATNGTRSAGQPANMAGVSDVPVPALGDTLRLAGGSSDASGSGTGGGGAEGDGKIKNITINIEKLIENLNIHTASMGESMEQVRAAVLETLMGAVNDTQLAIS